MIMQVAPKDAGKLAYVLVEMVHKEKARNKEIKTAKDVDKGLFEGILVHLYPDNSTRSYIVLSTAANKTVLVDTQHYNVLSIEVYDGNTREYLFCRDTTEDQEAAFSELSDILGALADVGKTTPGFDLVDLSCFTDLPKNFLDEVADAASKTGGTVSNQFNTTGRAASGFNQKHSSTGYVQSQTTYVSGTKTPTFFTRKTKLPHWKTLEQVRTKLKALAAGAKLEIPFPKTDTTEEVYCSGTYSRHSQFDQRNWD